jgi:hypothetical protein
MPNLFLIQLVGVILTVAGLIALIASIPLFGTPRSPEERRRATDEWNRRRDATAYRLPINLETFLSGIFFLSGLESLPGLNSIFVHSWLFGSHLCHR